MKFASKQPTLAVRTYRANRVRVIVQSTIISAVALGATLVVGMTGFTA